MSPLITLRDGTQVSEEVYHRFGCNPKTPDKEDYVKLFDMIERMLGKPGSAPPAGKQGLYFIDVTRGADGIRKVTLQSVQATEVTISIPHLEKTGKWPTDGVKVSLIDNRAKK